MSASEQWRQTLYEENVLRLLSMANRHLNLGRTSSDFLIVCIDVDDPAWTWLVDELMPNHDWQSIRRLGLTPVARGVVIVDLIEIICKICPDVAHAFQDPTEPHIVRALVMGGGGVSVYLLETTPDTQEVVT